jgi:hypothetical protein
MMTLTGARDYAREGVLMNSVDTGWVTDMSPGGVGASAALHETFVGPPLDDDDGAARVLDPVFRYEPCRVTLHHTIAHLATPHHSTLYHTIAHHTTPYHTTSRHTTLHHTARGGEGRDDGRRLFAVAALFTCLLCSIIPLTDLLLALCPLFVCTSTRIVLRCAALRPVAASHVNHHGREAHHGHFYKDYLRASW